VLLGDMYIHDNHATASFWGHSMRRSASSSQNLAELIAKDPNACVCLVLAAGPTSESISAIMQQFGAKCESKEITGAPRMEDLQDVKRKIEADAKERTLNVDKKFHRVCLCV